MTAIQWRHWGRGGGGPPRVIPSSSDTLMKV